MLFAFLTLLAQAADQGAGGQQAPPQSILPTLLTFVPIAILGYFLLMRPVQRQEKQRQALLSALKKNDRVVTSGGIIGVVAAIKDDEVSLRVDDSSNVRLRVTKSSIARILGDEGAKETKEGGA
jgi:preprotein translocase subunit YajC